MDSVNEEKVDATKNDCDIEVIIELDEKAFDNISTISDQISLKVHEDDEEYEQIPGQSGLTTIFNFKKFPQNNNDKDTLSLKESFKSIGFEVREDHSNVTKEHFIRKLKSLSEEDFSGRSSLIVFILTHGGLDGNFYTPDGDYITSWEIINVFTTPLIHPSLRNKPKIFIIQSCKYLNTKQYLSESEKVFKPNLRSTFKLPSDRHILLAYNIMEGTEASQKKNGSCYIQELCRNITTYGSREDICSLLIRVSRCVDHRNRKLNKYYIYKHIPTFVSTLIKKFYLCKGTRMTLENYDISCKDIEMLLEKHDTLDSYEIENKKLKDKIQELEKIIEENNAPKLISIDNMEWNEDKKVEEPVTKNLIDKTDSASQTFGKEVEEHSTELSILKLFNRWNISLFDIGTIVFIVFIMMLFISFIKFFGEPEETGTSYDWFNENMQFYTDLITNFIRNK